MRSEFEKTKTYGLCKSLQIDFDEDRKRYYSINPDLHVDVMSINSALCMFQEQQSKVDELQLKLSEDSRILHNVIDIERKKNDELQKQVTDLDNRATKYALDEMATAKLNGELQKRADAALEIAKQGIRKRGGDYYLEQLEQALKGEK
ncbi:hypothetical protein [uncultured Acinetobacter sp.]|uniref:hypothetical protein n=1 Tax=uncultured Acinetobacter sp. TaxID=165433 RepID=UPI0025D50038|nr:hypothetical protein [uncultured Acinetobacter sp.]